ncbi:MAG: SprT family zinc-dependent metalloprotease [Gammaproteobacteria bacterium]|nr:SprT family zinc-dependent metalloprotease [Gammaproteobacteria bacterium]
MDKFPTFSFNFEIKRSKRKTLSIIIKSGKVEVKSPIFVSEVDIYAFLTQKQAWIEKHLTEQEVKLTQKLVITDGYEVMFFGKPRRIEIIYASRPKVEVTDDRLLIYSRSNESRTLEKHFSSWLKHQASEYMTTQTIKTTRALGVEERLKEVVFRKTKTKWGHCCSDGTIQYNWLTMMAPKPVINYLIAHESSHLIHMNHSRKFWQTVATVCPDYKDLKDWLKTYGHRFWTE